MERFHPYNLKKNNRNTAEMENNSNPIPPLLPNPDALPNRNIRIEETQRTFEQAEKIMKSLQTPQLITTMQPFEGNPVKVHKFLRSVENLMPFLDPLKIPHLKKFGFKPLDPK